MENTLSTMEAHFNQTANATVEDPFFDVSMYLKAIVLFLVILVTIVGKSMSIYSQDNCFRQK